MLPGLCLLDDVRWLVEFDYMGDRIELAYVAPRGVEVLIVDWNLTDAGERAPLTDAVLDKLPASLVCAMAKAIKDDMRKIVAGVRSGRDERPGRATTQRAAAVRAGGRTPAYQPRPGHRLVLLRLA